MEKPDAYYGAIAAGYDDSRSRKAKWLAEIEAVREFVDAGPVLDIPVGTARFTPVYREKGLEFVGVDISDDMLAIARRKFSGIDVRKGSAFNLHFGENEFGTVVCVRFLEWLPLDRTAALLARLRQLAAALIVSINHGTDGKPEAYTYDLGKFLAALDGLFIAGRKVTANVKGITSELFKLRPARWSDVLDQFDHDGKDAAGELQRIADKHAGFVGLPSVPVNETTSRIRAEYWSGERLGAIVAAFAEHRFVTDVPPRRYDGPLTILRRSGIEFMIDGRHRANLNMRSIGPHPVLVIEC